MSEKQIGMELKKTAALLEKAKAQAVQTMGNYKSSGGLRGHTTFSPERGTRH